MQHIHTICTVDRHTSSSGHKSYDFITRNRIAALGEAHRHVIDSFDYDSAFRFCNVDFLIICLRNLLQDRRVCNLFFVIFSILFYQTVDHLTFF